MKFFGFIVFLCITNSVLAASWVASNLLQAKKLGEVNGAPVWLCNYRIGDEGNLTFNIKANQEECPIVVFYNIETNKWSKEYPIENGWQPIYRF